MPLHYFPSPKISRPEPTPQPPHTYTAPPHKNAPAHTPPADLPRNSTPPLTSAEKSCIIKHSILIELLFYGGVIC